MPMMEFGFHEFVVTASQQGIRLDKILGAREGCSRTLARKLIDAGAVFVNDRRVRRASQPVEAGDRIRAPDQLPPVLEVDLASRVLHRDAHVLVVDKPAGVPSAPTPLGIRGTLPHMLREQLGLSREPTVVHRLDSGASGVLALALTRTGAQRVSQWFTGKSVEKWYRALVVGSPPASAGTLDWPLARDPGRPGRMRVSPQGAPSRSDYRVLGTPEELTGCTGVSLQLFTGRTHQLRVHLAELGCPVLGDPWYGGRRVLTDPAGRRVTAGRLCLHAHRLLVTGAGPRGSRLELEAPLPDFFATLNSADT